MRGEGGQATVEWVGLVLVAALALGALAAFRGSGADPELGRALAARITCPASGSCAGAVPPVATAPRPAPPATRTRAAAGRRQAVDASRGLRGAGAVAKRLWLVCLGYRRLRYELDHPRAPNEPMPPAEALDIANTCLNPASFLTED